MSRLIATKPTGCCCCCCARPRHALRPRRATIPRSFTFLFISQFRRGLLRFIFQSVCQSVSSRSPRAHTSSTNSLERGGGVSARAHATRTPSPTGRLRSALPSGRPTPKSLSSTRYQIFPNANEPVMCSCVISRSRPARSSNGVLHPPSRSTAPPLPVKHKY
jgi:hypothetical protein